MTQDSYTESHRTGGGRERGFDATLSVSTQVMSEGNSGQGLWCTLVHSYLSHAWLLSHPNPLKWCEIVTQEVCKWTYDQIAGKCKTS